MSSVSATAEDSTRSRRSLLTAELVRLLEMAGVLVAFWVAYTAVQMLEDDGGTTRAIIRIIIAGVLLAVSTWRVRDRANVRHDDADPATLDVSWRKPREAAQAGLRSWQTMLFLALLVGATGLAIFLRFHRITSEPYGIWFDEAQNGIVAKGIVDGDRPIFIGGLTQLPALFFYVFAASIAIIGDTVTALRTVTAIAGIATVVLAYLLGRELFDHRTGVFAAFLLAVMRWHLNFSRFGMHGVFAPLFLVATLYFVARGLHNKGTWNFAVAGIMAGVGLQGYYGFLLAPFVGALYLLHYIIFERQLAWKELGKGILILAACATIVYAPLGIWAYRHPDEFNQRSSTVTITKDRTTSEVIDVAWDSAKKHLLMFNADGDRNGRHNIPGAPLLDTAMGLLFVLGVGYAVTRLNRSAAFLLLAWVAVSLQSGIWSVDFEAPQAYRTVMATPAVAMLAALPLSLLWRLGFDRPPPAEGEAAAPGRGSRAVQWALGGVAIAVIAGLLIWTARVNYDDYFNVQLRRFDAWAAYDTDATYVGKEMQRLGLDDYEYRVATVLHRRPVVQFLNPELVDRGKDKPFDWSTDIPSTGTGSTVYLFDGMKEPFWEWLQRLYPEGTFERFTPPLNDGVPIAYEAVIPAEAVLAYQGIDATYTPANGSPVEARETSMALDWSSEAPAPLPLDAVWETTLRIPAYAEQALSLRVPGSARMYIDGELVAEGTDTVEVMRRFYKGDHQLRIEARVERNGPIDLLLDGGSVLPGWFFNYPASEHGLLASFYSGAEFEGEPVLQQLDPFVGFQYHAELGGVATPFSARWEGLLQIDNPGVYAFELEGTEVISLFIDGEEVKVTPGERTELSLTAGEHEFEVRLKNTIGHARAFVYWWTPGATEREIIPPEAFVPR